MSGTDDDVARIPLAKMLGQLRQELVDAKAEGEGKDLKFVVKDIEIELQIATTQEKAGGVGIKFWVVSADGTLKDSSVQTQKVKLKLEPRQGPNDEPLQVSDQDFIPS